MLGLLDVITVDLALHKVRRRHNLVILDLLCLVCVNKFEYCTVDAVHGLIGVDRGGTKQIFYCLTKLGKHNYVSIERKAYQKNKYRIAEQGRLLASEIASELIIVGNRLVD